MEALSEVHNFASNGDLHHESKYEYLSNTIYQKDVECFNKIYDYLVKQAVEDGSKIMKFDDENIKNILKDSKEINTNINGVDYKKTLIEWIDKYTEDYIDRLHGHWYKFYLYDDVFVLTSSSNSEIESKKLARYKISPIKSVTGVSIVDLFKSLGPVKLSVSEAKWVSNVNKNLKKIAAMF